MKRWWRSGYAGCLLVALLCLLILCGCTACFFYSTQREPEIPVNYLLRKQLEALPPGWSLARGRIDASDIWTDTDFTWARWAVNTNFNYKENPQIFISEEIHVFRSSFMARVTLSPSPRSIYAGEGYIPEGWSYRPPHANRFEFGCEGGDGVAQPERCSVLLRYKEYVIVIFTPIADYMTLGDLKRILELIDQEMATYLQNSTLRPGPREVPSSLDE
jgi:hypothetical protein